jgi:hypothetical protein
MCNDFAAVMDGAVLNELPYYLVKEHDGSLVDRGPGHR